MDQHLPPFFGFLLEQTNRSMGGIIDKLTDDKHPLGTLAQVWDGGLGFRGRKVDVSCFLRHVLHLNLRNFNDFSS